MTPTIEVRSQKQQRTFTVDEKARILAEYEAAQSALERVALMRREGVYSSLICNWRKQLSVKAATKRGRPANIVMFKHVATNRYLNLAERNGRVVSCQYDSKTGGVVERDVDEGFLYARKSP